MERFICWFSVAISTACALLNVEKFYPDQEEASCNFFKGNDFFDYHVLIMADVLKWWPSNLHKSVSSTYAHWHKYGTCYIAIMITYEESSKAY
jgi:hypothetical protein